MEEALTETYLAGVSARRAEDITEALWGSKVSPVTISELNKKACVRHGETGPCRAGGARMFMQMGSAWGKTGTERLRMLRFWWRLR